MLTAFLTENLFGTQFEKIIKESLVTNVPISSVRLHDRGFNQTEEFAKEIAEKLNLKYSGDFLGRRIEFGHQSLRDKDERGYNLENEFYIKENIHLGKYKSITIVDDVLTTGATLESIINIIRKAYKVDIEINAICMFRGRPYYSKM